MIRFKLLFQRVINAIKILLILFQVSVGYACLELLILGLSCSEIVSKRKNICPVAQNGFTIGLMPFDFVVIPRKIDKRTGIKQG